MEPFPCSHDELKWGRKIEVLGGKEIIVCGRCREEMPAVYTKPKISYGLPSHSVNPMLNPVSEGRKK